MSPIDSETIYIEYINSLLQNGIKLEEITSLEEFRDFRKNNLINFGDAASVDMYFFGYSSALTYLVIYVINLIINIKFYIFSTS
jgi:hypothetical protein